MTKAVLEAGERGGYGERGRRYPITLSGGPCKPARFVDGAA